MENEVYDSNEGLKEKKLFKYLSLFSIAMLPILLGALAYTYLLHIPSIQQGVKTMEEEKKSLTLNIKELEEAKINVESSFEAESKVSAQLKQLNSELNTSNVIKDRTIKILSDINQKLLLKDVNENKLLSIPEEKKVSKAMAEKKIKTLISEIKSLNSQLELVEITVMKELEAEKTVEENNVQEIKAEVTDELNNTTEATDTTVVESEKESSETTEETTTDLESITEGINAEPKKEGELDLEEIF